VDQPRHPTSQQTRLGFAAKTTLPCALSLSWIPADFRLRVVELGPRSHPHSEEWMCFFGPDASFRDLQRPTASHGHVPACPILARCEGVASVINVWVVWLLFRASGQISLATNSCGPIWTTTARRAFFCCPTTRLETQSPSTRGSKPAIAFTRWRHGSCACRSTARKGREELTSPAMAYAVQSLLDSLPSPSCRA
jgi:hypothetical protein